MATATLSVTSKDTRIAQNTGRRYFLMDDELHIVVSGISEPCRVIELRCFAEDDKGVRMESKARYWVKRISGESLVDLSVEEAFEGDFLGCEPMGLFWSMRPSPGQKKGLRFMQRDVTKPVVSRLEVHEVTVQTPDPSLGMVLDGANLLETFKEVLAKVAEVLIDRSYMDLDGSVARLSVKTGRLRGSLFIPREPAFRSAIVDTFGTAGGLIEFRAAILASRLRVPVFAMAYFAYDDLPTSYFDLDLSIFTEAFTFLKQNYGAEKIGFVGVSLGAQIGLVLASLLPMISKETSSLLDGVVSISPMHILTQNFTFEDKDRSVFRIFNNSPPDAPINFLEFGVESVMYFPNSSSVTAYPAFHRAFDSSDPFIRSIIIPIERTESKVLMLCGAHDLNSPASDSARYLEKNYREKSGGKKLLEAVHLPRTGHLIEPPFAPHCFASWHRTLSGNLSWGGEPLGHAQGQNIAWHKTISFFVDLFAPTSSSSSFCVPKPKL